VLESVSAGGVNVPSHDRRLARALLLLDLKPKQAAPEWLLASDTDLY
jgi:hypothetical protein